MKIRSTEYHDIKGNCVYFKNFTYGMILTQKLVLGKNGIEFVGRRLDFTDSHQIVTDNIFKIKHGLVVL